MINVICWLSFALLLGDCSYRIGRQSVYTDLRDCRRELDLAKSDSARALNICLTNKKY